MTVGLSTVNIGNLRITFLVRVWSMNIEAERTDKNIKSVHGSERWQRDILIPVQYLRLLNMHVIIWINTGPANNPCYSYVSSFQFNAT